MKVGLIYQPCGLGDILFLQKIAWRMKQLKYEVYWPVIDQYSFLQEHIPQFNWVPWQDPQKTLTRPPLPDSVEFPHKELYLPETETKQSDDLFFFQGFINCRPIMSGKYHSIEMPWANWYEYIIFERNNEREKKLVEILDLNLNEEYHVVCDTFGSRFRTKKVPRPEGKIVEVKVYDTFSAFDWCIVFENAASITMTATSFTLLLESPQLRNTMMNKELNLYHRTGNFSDVDYLLSLPWNYKK